MSIKFMQGSVFKTKAPIIAHQVNNLGIMGAGVAKQIKEKYPEAYQTYASTYKLYRLGDVLFTHTNQGLIIANCFSQSGISRSHMTTDYDSFWMCMHNLERFMKEWGIDKVAIPYKMGCGLAGGDWKNEVFPIIKDVFSKSDKIIEIWRL